MDLGAAQETVGEYLTSAQEFLWKKEVIYSLAGCAAVVLTGATIRCFWTEVPSGIYREDRWTLRKLHAKSEMHHLLSVVGSKLGFGTTWEIHRWLQKKKRPNDQEKTGIYVERLHFSGVPVLLLRRDQWHQHEGSDQELRPAVVYIYGGGWCLDTSNNYFEVHKYLVNHLAAAVLVIDYHKAPENPFPVPFHECLAAIQFFHEHAEDYGVDPDRIHLLGDSAGGTMALAITLKLLEEHKPNIIKSEVLLYPVAQSINFKTKSYLKKYPLASRKEVATMILAYAGEDPKLLKGVLNNDHQCPEFLANPGWRVLEKYVPVAPKLPGELPERLRNFRSKSLDPDIFPLMASSFAGLPPTLVIACQYDILRDDTLALGDRLLEGKVKAVVKTFPTTHRAFQYFHRLRGGREIMDAVCEHFAANL